MIHCKEGSVQNEPWLWELKKFYPSVERSVRSQVTYSTNTDSTAQISANSIQSIEL